jgi:hypothetical protein
MAELGMQPGHLYPRRSRFAPKEQSDVYQYNTDCPTVNLKRAISVLPVSPFANYGNDLSIKRNSTSDLPIKPFAVGPEKVKSKKSQCAK